MDGRKSSSTHSGACGSRHTRCRSRRVCGAVRSTASAKRAKPTVRLDREGSWLGYRKDCRFALGDSRKGSGPGAQLIAEACGNSDLVTTLGATTGKHGCAALGLHTGAKAMSLGPVAAVWLERTFWHRWSNSSENFIKPHSRLPGCGSCGGSVATPVDCTLTRKTGVARRESAFGDEP